MALILAISKTSISTDGTTLVVTDTTGNYDVTTNPGGYGSPNETRANLYLKLFVSIRKSTGREYLTVPAYNENTATTWTITDTADGWHELYLFGCLAWGSGITYQVGYITYDAGTDAYYKSLQSTNLNNAVTDTAWWAVTTDIDDFSAAITLAQPDIYADTTNYIETITSQKGEAQMLLDAECDCCDECAMQDYERVRMKIEAAVINEGLGDYTGAQEIIESVEDILVNQNVGG